MAKGIPDSCFERVAKPEHNIKKLKAGRIDLIAYSFDSLMIKAKALGLDPNDFVAVKVVSVLPMCYAFHKDTPDEIITRFQKALDKLEPKRLELLKKY